MANINKIKLSGTTYSIQDENATKTVELTQAQYDALSTKDPNTFYIITDATAGDLSNYYTKSETSGATQISTALASKQTTLTAGTGIDITDNVISATGGGGKAVSAGTNISITTGETADTINCTLPIETISNSYGVSQIYVGDNIYKNNNYGAIVIASKDNSSTGKTRVEFADGAISIGSTNNVFHNGIAIGKNATAGAINSWGHIAIGTNVKATGSTKTNINNQIKVDTSNQVYIYNKDNTEMICLQDQLGGSSYTAGDGIDITNDVISVTGKVDTSAITSAVTSASTDSQVPTAKAVNDKLGGLSLVKLSQSAYDALSPNFDSNTLYIINE